MKELPQPQTDGRREIENAGIARRADPDLRRVDGNRVAVIKIRLIKRDKLVKRDVAVEVQQGGGRMP